MSLMLRPLLLVLCVYGVTSQAAAQSATEARVVTLMLTNDMHGRIMTDNPGQGLAYLGTLVEQAREDAPDLLLFDAGDTISGQPNSLVTKGQAIVAAMSALKYDAMVVGNHEFDQGCAVAAAAFEAADFPILSANTEDTEADDGRWAPIEPYRVYGVDGVKVGVFGLTTMYTMRYAYPGWITPVVVHDPFVKAQRTVDHLREQEGVDLVVSLNHLGYKVDVEVAKEVEGIDVILGGHSHTFLEEPVYIGDTLVMQAGSWARVIGRIDILFEPDGGGYRLAAFNGRDGKWWGHDGVPVPESQLGSGVAYPDSILLRPTADTPPHQGVLDAYAPFREQVEAWLDEPLAHVEEPIHGEDHKHTETPMGNLIADAVRWHADADVGVYLAYQFRRRSFEPGTVTRRELFDLIGSYTRQHVVSVESPGLFVTDMLGGAIADTGEIGLYVSGVRLDGEPHFDSGDPIAPRRRYVVAGAAHVMQDHFIGKPGVVIVDDSLLAPVCREALAQYLKHLGSVRAPDTGRLGLPTPEAAVPADAR